MFLVQNVSYPVVTYGHASQWLKKLKAKEKHKKEKKKKKETSFMGRSP